MKGISKFDDRFQHILSVVFCCGTVTPYSDIGVVDSPGRAV